MTLKAGIVEPGKTIARQQLGKHVPAAIEYAKNNRRNIGGDVFFAVPAKVCSAQDSG
jgi:hypothetical protein